MTIVILRQEHTHDLQHDLLHMEDQRLSATLKSVAGVILPVQGLAQGIQLVCRRDTLSRGQRTKRDPLCQESKLGKEEAR